MNTLTIDHKNGHSTTYQLIEEKGNLPIAYHLGTSKKVIEVLEQCRKNRQRIKLYYGDIETGKDWTEEHETVGYIGLSRGYEARFPILVYNERSYGGGTILDDCIVKIKESKGNIVLYKADNYQQPKIEIVPTNYTDFPYETHVNGELYGSHTTLRDAQNVKAKLS